MELPRANEEKSVALDAMFCAIEENGALTFEKVMEFVLSRNIPYC